MMAEKIKIKDVNLLFLALSSLFISCGSTIGMRTPINSFISPESTGKSFRGEVNLFYSVATNADIDLSDTSSEHNIVVGEESNLSNIIGINGAMGIIPRLDFIAQSAGSKNPVMAGLRFQLLGDTRQNTSKGNHSLSIVGLYGASSDSQQNDEDVELTPKDEEAEADIEMEATEIRLIYGYRISKNWLTYFGLTQGSSNFNGKVESDNVLLDGKKLDYDSNYTGANLGFNFHARKVFQLKIEAAAHKIKWNEADETTRGLLLASVGFFWD